MPDKTWVSRPAIEQSRPPVWALCFFGAYLAWNIKWLAAREVPPSLLLALFGIPCPTTGCMRSLAALLQGELRASLLWNPFTIPILLITFLSVILLLLAALRKRDLVLPARVGTAWWIVLLLAWISKLLLGRTYW